MKEIHRPGRGDINNRLGKECTDPDGSVQSAWLTGSGRENPHASWRHHVGLNARFKSALPKDTTGAASSERHRSPYARISREDEMNVAWKVTEVREASQSFISKMTSEEQTMLWNKLALPDQKTDTGELLSLSKLPELALKHARLQPAFKQARDVLVESHSGLVGPVAYKFRDKGLDMDHLFNVGQVGLIEGAERFDPGKGHDFADFALPTIRGKIQREIRDNQSIYRPRRDREFSLQVQSTRDQLERDFQRSVTPQEIAAVIPQTGPEGKPITAKEVSEGLLGVHLFSRDAWSEDGKFPNAANPNAKYMADKDQNVEESVLDREMLRRVVPSLPSHMQEVVRFKFWDDMPQVEIGKKLDMSAMQVNRLLQKAYRELRQSIELPKK